MKKLILFIYMGCIAACFGYSQMSLSLADSTGPLINNAIIYKTGSPLDDEIVSYVFVKNNTSNTIPVLVKKVVIDTVPGSYNMFCWGSCFAPSVYISPNPININGEVTDSLDFSGHYVPNTFSGTSSLRYVFFNRNNPLDSVCVNVVYSAFHVGIEILSEEGKISNAYPNPANNSTTIDYSLTSSSSGSLIIRNFLGSIVKEYPLTSNSGKVTILTGDLLEGVYFFTLNMDGKTAISRKLIVRH